jgi:hypothetical protein
MAPVIEVLVLILPTVSAAFGVKGGHYLHQIRPKTFQHLFDHVIGSNAQDLVSDFCWQMSVAEVPSYARQLMGIPVPDFDNELGSRPYFEPPPIVELQPISIRHCDRFRKVEENFFALIREQTNPSPVAPLEIEREASCSLVCRPSP